MYKELLLEIIQNWNDEQLMRYIEEQEERLENTRTLLIELRAIERKRKKKKPLDTGVRGGL